MSERRSFCCIFLYHTQGGSPWYLTGHQLEGWYQKPSPGWCSVCTSPVKSIVGPNSQLQILCMSLWPAFTSQETLNQQWPPYGSFDTTHLTTLRLILQDLRPSQRDYYYLFKNAKLLCCRNGMAQVNSRRHDCDPWAFVKATMIL